MQLVISFFSLIGHIIKSAFALVGIVLKFTLGMIFVGFVLLFLLVFGLLHLIA
ncbi:hypothetical protein KKC97_00015 [bacterium]|nr:hypothetical protein [bacterium]MBU1636034.1 hypothetical protein [bacterium]MBU1920243.1 hypothetical protein [bacterium]